MKRNFLFVLVGIIAMMTSCNKEEVGSLATNKTTSFNVSVDDGIKTRAGNKVTDLTRYVMEVYKGATATGTPELHKEQATGIFTDILLDNAQEYTVLFWADYGTPSADGTHNAANEYNAADLKVAKVAKQPIKAAYSGVSKFTVGTTDESAYTNVELKHAVAQVSFVQTEKLTSATNRLTVSYPESYSLNVEDNAVTEIDGVVTHNFTYNNDVAGTLGTSYIIAATGTSKTVLEITVTLNSETAIAVSNVPFERNFRTNISGAYSSKYSAVLNVSCDDTWGTPDEDVEIPTDEKSLIGYYYYSDGSCESTFTSVGKTCVGIVFWESEDGTQAKIADLTDSEKLMWADESLGSKEWGFSDKVDGAAATKAVINDQIENEDFEYYYPLFYWIYNTKNGGDVNGRWYVPAIDELEQLLKAATENETFKSSLATAGTAFKREIGNIPAWYWTCTEGRPGGTGKLAINVAEIRSANTVFKQFTLKGGSTCVRAISAITISK